MNTSKRDYEHEENVRQFFDGVKKIHKSIKSKQRPLTMPRLKLRRRFRRFPKVVATNRTSEIITNANLG
jgi:hypothetical protein